MSTHFFETLPERALLACVDIDCPLYNQLTGCPLSCTEFTDFVGNGIFNSPLLTDNLSNPVQWEQCIAALNTYGVLLNMRLEAQCAYVVGEITRQNATTADQMNTLSEEWACLGSAAAADVEALVNIYTNSTSDIAVLQRLLTAVGQTNQLNAANFPLLNTTIAAEAASLISDFDNYLTNQPIALAEQARIDALIAGTL